MASSIVLAAKTGEVEARKVIFPRQKGKKSAKRAQRLTLSASKHLLTSPPRHETWRK